MSAAELPPIPDTQPRPVPPLEGFAPGDVADWIAWAGRALEASSPSARADAEELMAAQLGLARAQLVARREDPMPAARALQYAAVIERRRVGEPVAYITGRQGFWSLELGVTPAVLIPRADTETLVEWAVQLARAATDVLGAPIRIADLGTGSGAIALSLAQELKRGARIVATDRSDAALSVARENARVLGIDTVEFRAGDWCAAVDGEMFDLIVSNPPYIAEGDAHLAALRHEPRMALTSGAEGLDAIRQIVRGAPTHLDAGGWLLLEHGHDQAAAVRALLTQAGFTDVETRRDFGGNDRVSGGRRP